jgi:hypothetical protein
MEYGRWLSPFLNGEYSEFDDQNSGQTPLHVKIDVTHSDEMNDKIFDIDID